MDHMKQNIRIYQVPSGLEVLHSAIACFPHLWGTDITNDGGIGPKSTAFYELRDSAPFVRIIGDAHRVSTITNAVYEGYHAALDI